MERWVEHYSELYSREECFVDLALNAIETLPIMGELVAEQTLEEQQDYRRLGLRQSF